MLARAREKEREKEREREREREREIPRNLRPKDPSRLDGRVRNAAAGGASHKLCRRGTLALGEDPKVHAGDL